MKKIISILLCAVMLSVYFTVFSVPAMATEHTVNNLEELYNALYYSKDGDKVIVMGNEETYETWYVIDPIKVNKSCNVEFHNVNLMIGNKDYNYYNSCLIEVNANNATLDFYNCTIDTDQHDLLGDGKLVCEEYGSIIYVDGENCQIDCHNSSTFRGKTSAGLGGAIYIDNRNNCVIKNTKFEYCESSDQGGAIYVWGENCVIENCKFSGCYAPNGGSNVFSYYEGETSVKGCADTDGNDIDKNTCVNCNFESVDDYKRKNNPSLILHPAYPEDGYYIIRSAVNPRFCLDIEGGSTAKDNGAKLHLLPANASTAKTFEIKKDGSVYKIIAAHSGKVLDVENSLPENGINIQQWEDGGYSNQRWIFEDDAPGENCYYIHSILGGSAGWMDAAGCVNGATPKDDGSTNVYSWSYTGANNQMWILEKVDSGCATFILNSNASKENDIFKLSTHQATNQGWYAGGKFDWIKIEAKDSQNIVIDRVEAKIETQRTYFETIGISSGNITKLPKYDGDYGVVSYINNPSFKFSDGIRFNLISEIKIYYRYNTSSTGSTISEGNGWIVAAVGGAAVIGLAVIIAKKKKKAAAETTEEATETEEKEE